MFTIQIDQSRQTNSNLGRVKVLFYGDLSNISSLITCEEVKKTCIPYFSGRVTSEVRSRTHLNVRSYVFKTLSWHHPLRWSPSRNHFWTTSSCNHKATQQAGCSISLNLCSAISNTLYDVVYLEIYHVLEVLISFILGGVKLVPLILCMWPFSCFSCSRKTPTYFLTSGITLSLSLKSSTTWHFEFKGSKPLRL